MKLSKLFIRYLSLIERTSRIDVVGAECLTENVMAGFWHEHSFIMCLVLKFMAERGINATIAITGDPRGDYIADMVRHAGGTAYRLNYSEDSVLSAVRSLSTEIVKEGANLATPLDGPLGPRHRPKKFLFLIARKTGKNFLGIRVEYSRKLRLWNRWDKYVVPLPFSDIRITLRSFGRVTEDNLKNFSGYAQTIQDFLKPETAKIGDATPAALGAGKA